MRRAVVDTNVLVVANGRNTNAAPACREASIRALMALLADGVIVLDVAKAILKEYREYCSPSGQPGVGDRFFYEVLMRYDGKVLRVDLPINDEGQYTHFPTDPELSGFDRSDRKFAAAARVGRAPVLNATDTDWHDFADPLARHGIKVRFLCGEDPELWFAPDPPPHPVTRTRTGITHGSGPPIRTANRSRPAKPGAGR